MADIKDEVHHILAAVIVAKQQSLEPLRKMRDELSEDGSSKEDAQVFIQTIANNETYLGREDAKSLITSVALAHKIYAGLGDYGNGEFLVLDQYADGCYGVSVGEWISSSESC